MKLLLDANIGRRAADALRKAGYDIERVAADRNSPSIRQSWLTRYANGGLVTVDPQKIRVRSNLGGA